MKKKKIFFALAWGLFGIYCLLLIKFLFLEYHYVSEGSFGAYISTHVNFIPFKTLFDYISRLAQDRINVSTVVVNLVGNFVLFLPMGAFLPVLAPKIRTFWKTVLSIALIVLLVECLQLCLRVGSFDVDDLIFNVGGAMIGFTLIKIPFIRVLLQKTDLI